MMKTIFFYCFFCAFKKNLISNKRVKLRHWKNQMEFPISFFHFSLKELSILFIHVEQALVKFFRQTKTKKLSSDMCMTEKDVLLSWEERKNAGEIFSTQLIVCMTIDSVLWHSSSTLQKKNETTIKIAAS